MTMVDDDLSLTFAALADPTRRAILSRLAGGEATVSQIAEPFALTQQAISKHLKILERAGLISRTRAAQSRPCKLEGEHLDTAAEWIGRHRRRWRECHGNRRRNTNDRRNCFGYSHGRGQRTSGARDRIDQERRFGGYQPYSAG